MAHMAASMGQGGGIGMFENSSMSGGKRRRTGGRRSIRRKYCGGNESAVEAVSGVLKSLTGQGGGRRSRRSKRSSRKRSSRKRSSRKRSSRTRSKKQRGGIFLGV
jgi:hypothetical protein